MTSENLLQIEHIDEDVLQKNWSWWNFGAAFGLLGGMFTILIGFVLTLIIWLLKDNSLQTLTNSLFYLAFPLLLLGATSLDKIDEKNKKYRNEKQK